MASDPPSKSWQSRIGSAGGADALAQSFVESISYDRRLYKHDIAGSIAHATMLAKVGLITDAERDAIVQGLKSIDILSPEITPPQRPSSDRSKNAARPSYSPSIMGRRLLPSLSRISGTTHGGT